MGLLKLAGLAYNPRPTPESWLRRAFLGLTAVVFGVTMALGILEIWIRHLGTAEFFATAKKRQSYAAETKGLPVLTSVFELASPNMRGLFHGVVYTSNSAGFRSNRNYSSEPPPGVLRIAIVGDSFVMARRRGCVLPPAARRARSSGCRRASTDTPHS
jgi:hypothetical protein